MAKLNQARRDLIRLLRANGHTYELIGSIMWPPVSKQAIQDICKKCGYKVLDGYKRKSYK